MNHVLGLIAFCLALAVLDNTPFASDKISGIMNQAGMHRGTLLQAEARLRGINTVVTAEVGRIKSDIARMPLIDELGNELSNVEVFSISNPFSMAGKSMRVSPAAE